MILLDTHTLIWITQGQTEVGPISIATSDEALASGELAVSAITFWEIAVLHRKGRLQMIQPLTSYRSDLLGLGVVEIPVSGDAGIEAANLEDFHQDPADRIITATALLHRAILVTADRRILGWKGSLHRLDART